MLILSYYVGVRDSNFEINGVGNRVVRLLGPIGVVVITVAPCSSLCFQILVVFPLLFFSATPFSLFSLRSCYLIPLHLVLVPQLFLSVSGCLFLLLFDLVL